MYWWRISKLTEDFRKGRVDEKDRFKYFLATVILWNLLAQPFAYYGSTFKIVDVVSAAITTATVIAGTILCYRANSRGDNTDFIGRMVCLGWPLAIRVSVVAIVTVTIEIALIHIGGTATGSTSEQIDAARDVAEVVIVSALGILYYWLLLKHVRLVARPMEALGTFI